MWTNLKLDMQCRPNLLYTIIYHDSVYCFLDVLARMLIGGMPHTLRDIVDVNTGIT